MIKELRAKSPEALATQLAELQAELAELYITQRTREFKANHKFKQHKLLIAQIKTLQREKTLSAEVDNG